MQRGSNVSGATSICVADGYLWNAAYAHAYFMRMAGSIISPLYCQQTTPRMPQNAPQNVLNLKISRFAAYPPSADLPTPMHVTYLFNNLRTGLRRQQNRQKRGAEANRPPSGSMWLHACVEHQQSLSGGIWLESSSSSKTSIIMERIHRARCAFLTGSWVLIMGCSTHCLPAV